MTDQLLNRAPLNRSVDCTGEARQYSAKAGAGAERASILAARTDPPRGAATLSDALDAIPALAPSS